MPFLFFAGTGKGKSCNGCKQIGNDCDQEVDLKLESLHVKDIMVPIAEYATVSQDATLSEAIMALEKAQAALDQARYKHRAILVLDNENQVVGKLSQLDVIRGLEPGYREAVSGTEVRNWALSKDILETMFKDRQLWQKPLKDICKKASQIHVRDIMYTPAKGEYVSQDASLNEAIHQLVMGHHQSLLVCDDNKVIGILRLSDVFSALIQIIHQCEL